MPQKKRLVVPEQKKVIVSDAAAPKSDTVLVAKDVKPLFFMFLSEAADKYSIKVSDPALGHVAGVMAGFTQTESLFRFSSHLRPLALMFLEAAQQEGRQRISAIQSLGDSALFIAGFAPDFYRRKTVDVDYCINMGRAAYGTLSRLLDENDVYGPGQGIYHELSRNFTDVVDVVAGASEKLHPPGGDLLRACELWSKTGSKRIGQQLRESGIMPAPSDMKLQ